MARLSHLLLLLIWSCVPLQAQQSRLLQPEDLFTLKEIRAVKLSPDGSEVIFTVFENDLKKDRGLTTIWRLKTDGKSQPVRLTDNERDSSPQWLSDGKRVALLSNRDGAAQVWLLNLGDNQAQKVTNIQGGIISFSWSPRTNLLAVAVRSIRADSYGQAIENKEKRGVVIDKKTFSFHQLIRNQLFLDLENPIHLWLVDTKTGKAEKLSDDLQVDNYVWAPDGNLLAISGRGETAGSGIFLYSVKDKQLKLILKSGGGISYSNPLWSPDGKTLAVKYRDSPAEGKFGLYSVDDSKFSVVTPQGEVEFYNPTFEWVKGNEIYLENTFRAGRQLFGLSVPKGEVRSVIDSGGYDNNFSFTADGKQVAFVRQTLQEPPELCIAAAPFNAARRLSSLNQHLTSFQLPEVERVKWTSSDGREVEGWLFKPLNFTAGKAYPLLVMVHGGPTFVVSNRFEPYSGDRGGWIWPYPFRLFANRGYGVFVPNYRGTGSYGASFRSASDEFKEPVDDIVTGISHLVKNGLVDPGQIGIMGQSHGALLGPYVMAKHRIFKASSFAEGLGNLMTSYAYVHGQHNLRFGESGGRGHPYNNPEGYIARSSIFHFKGLETATLLEFGEQSAAILGLEMLSSLWRQGVPHEMVIYPKSGHNLTSPVLQLDSINRNLDWFDYWMLGKKDPAPEKEEQYTRWEKMVEEMKEMRKRG